MCIRKVEEIFKVVKGIIRDLQKAEAELSTPVAESLSTECAL